MDFAYMKQPRKETLQERLFNRRTELQSLLFVRLMFLSNTMHPRLYKLLAEWLEVYDYILPADRKVNKALLHYLVDHCETISEIYSFTFVLENMSQATQKRILQWTNEYSN